MGGGCSVGAFCGQSVVALWVGLQWCDVLGWVAGEQRAFAKLAHSSPPYLTATPYSKLKTNANNTTYRFLALALVWVSVPLSLHIFCALVAPKAQLVAGFLYRSDQSSFQVLLTSGRIDVFYSHWLITELCILLDVALLRLLFNF